MTILEQTPPLELFFSNEIFSTVIENGLLGL